MSVFWAAAVSLLIRAVPAHLLAYYPFRDRLRFPLWRVLLAVCAVQAGQSLLYGYAVWQGGSGQAVAYGLSLVYMAVYFFSVRDSRSKVLFLYLLVMDYVMILRGAAAFVEARLFYRPGMTFDSWISVLLNLLVLAVSAPFLLRFFTRAREKVFRVDAPGFWRTAWMVPAFTTGIVMIFTAGFEPERVRSLGFLFSRVLLLLCVFVVYSNLLNALDGIRRQAALAEQAAAQEQLLHLQRTQHGQLLKHMEEVKAARHDLRQHLGVLEAYLEQRDVAGLEAYLRAYERALPTDTRMAFTKNFALNAVCAYYAEEARRYGIEYDIQLDMPEQLPISEPEVCALLGNLLENAVDACREAGGAPFIRARGLWEEGHMVLTVDNSCAREPVWQDGRLLSSKHEGLGTGTRAVQAAAERTGGAAEFSCRDGVFYASVLLYT